MMILIRAKFAESAKNKSCKSNKCENRLYMVMLNFLNILENTINKLK